MSRPSVALRPPTALAGAVRRGGQAPGPWSIGSTGIVPLLDPCWRVAIRARSGENIRFGVGRWVAPLVGVPAVMARVSLIPVSLDQAQGPADRLASFRERLERAGHTVEVESSAAETHDARAEGLAAVMVRRVRAASGQFLVVVDPAMAYTADDVAAVVDRLEASGVPLVVAARPGRWYGPVARRLVGTTDPTSGLVGLTRSAAQAAAQRFAPVGSRFAGELLARIEGERADVRVATVADPRRRWVPMDDIRHAKRIADDRLGNLSRLFQFCFVGASGMVVDLSVYAALLAILSLTPLGGRLLFQVATSASPITLAVGVAAVLAIALAMTWNFSLNRRLTFNDARRGSILRQYCRYALSNLAGIAVSLAFRLILPGSIPFFGRHRLLAAVAGIVAATGISFTLSRWFVFRTKPAPTARGLAGAAGAQPLDRNHPQERPAFHPAAGRVAAGAEPISR